MKLRSTFGFWISLIVWAIAAGTVVSFAWTTNPGQVLLYIWPIALFCLLVWAIFWRPVLILDDELIQVINPVSEYRLNYAAVQRIDTKYTLTLYTADHKIVVWSAPAPSRYATLRMAREEGKHLPESSYLDNAIRPGDLPTSESGSAALIMRRVWERKRDAGELDGTPHIAVRYQWIWPSVAGVLTVLTAIIPLF